MTALRHSLNGNNSTQHYHTRGGCKNASTLFTFHKGTLIWVFLAAS